VITLVDSSLRDGMHSVRHQFKPHQVARVAGALDRAGVDVVEVTHGDGLGGSSIQYGESAAADIELIRAAVESVSRARIAVLLLPGIGTVRDLREARAAGATVARIATHCTEADISQQHIAWAREHEMTTVGFLMMSHMIEPPALAAQAQLMASYGADVVYAVDSAGALVPAGAAARVRAVRNAVDCEVGFHAHNNLGCAVGNALAAVAEGASWLDGSVRGLGAGAGNAATEVLACALERDGREVRADLYELMDVAEDVVRPLMGREQIIDRPALVIGYAGVYSSFLLHAERAAQKYGVPARDILLEIGRRRIVGGQEDTIIEIASELVPSQEPAARGAGT
jgi:4-hydroxy-2-oxovalerate aldolase